MSKRDEYPMIPEVLPAGRGRWIMVLSALSVIFTFAHSVEDFEYPIAARLRQSTLLAAFLLSLTYAAQVWGTALSAREIRLGYWVNLALALFWFVGVVADHLGEILFASPFRSGVPSKRLERRTVIVSAFWAFASVQQVVSSAAPTGRSAALDRGWAERIASRFANGRN